MHLSIPENLPASLAERFARVARRVADLDIMLADAELAVAGRVLTISEFVLNVLERSPERLRDRLSARQPLVASDIATQLEDLQTRAEADAMAHLRLVRDVELARVAWRMFSGAEDAATVLESLSTLADELVTAALNYVTEQAGERAAGVLSAQADPHRCWSWRWASSAAR